MIDPNPKVGELWLLREDMGLPEERRLMLITAVYQADYPDTEKYVAVDGMMDGRIMTSLGTGWLVKKVAESEEEDEDW